LGTINLSQASTIDASATTATNNDAGSVSIRGGQLVMNGSSIKARAASPFSITPTPSGGTIEVTAEQVSLSNHSTIDASVVHQAPNESPAEITFNVGTFSATDSAILAKEQGFGIPSSAGAVTIQGLQGSGTFAKVISLTNTEVATSASCCPFQMPGPILLRADNIALNQSTLNASGVDSPAGRGPITLVSRGDLNILNSSLVTTTGLGFGGAVDLNAGRTINLTGTIIDTRAAGGFLLGSGPITLAAAFISLQGSTLESGTGIMSLSATKAVTLDSTVLSANGRNGGTIQINGGAQLTSQQSTISATRFGQVAGTISLEATTVKLTDTQVTTSVSGDPQTVGGSITVDAKSLTLTNSQLLSTATEGHGGTINITSPALHRDAGSVIDASSQSGTDGTVTINGIIQP
jgi:hypothetical protein